MPAQHLADQGERVLRSLGKVTGVTGYTCPWQAMRDPFVIAVSRAHRWLQKDVPLETQYPAGVPKALLDGLQVYEAALDRVTLHDLRKRQEERERERNGPSGVPSHFGTRKHRSPRKPR